MATQPQTYVETKLFSVTSNTATTKNNGSFLSDVAFECNNFIHAEGIINLDVALIHAEIPVSFYVINEYNHILRFKMDTDPIETVYVPYGNYNSSSLITALNTVINHANFVITINKLTGKLLFSHNKAFIIYNDFDFSIGTVLGFNPNTINNSVGVSNPYTLTPPNLLNLLGAKKINIVSNELNTINYSSEVGSLSMLSSIAIDQPAYGLVIYENKSGIKHNLRVRDINKVDIQLLDENHNLINFNNIDWALLLCFYITRQNNLTTGGSFNNLIQDPSGNLAKRGEVKEPDPEMLNDLVFLST